MLSLGATALTLLTKLIQLPHATADVSPSSSPLKDVSPRETSLSGDEPGETSAVLRLYVIACSTNAR